MVVANLCKIDFGHHPTKELVSYHINGIISSEINVHVNDIQSSFFKLFHTVYLILYTASACTVRGSRFVFLFHL